MPCKGSFPGKRFFLGDYTIGARDIKSRRNRNDPQSITNIMDSHGNDLKGDKMYRNTKVEVNVLGSEGKVSEECAALGSFASGSHVVLG